MMSFSKILIYWYLQNKRDLPWRETKDPYIVWLSEIILQQTRIAQGIAYYFKFVERFPTVQDLASADQEEVLKLWQGLGYYSRARNLHYTAKYICENYDGEFPKKYKELIKLKGVGDYTASAIASFSFNQPEAVVDGNVYRLLARFFGIETPINTTKGNKEFKDLAQSLIDKEEPGVYNQAIMDFGSIQCKPQNPDCYQCPLVSSCVAYQKKRIKDLPVKEKKIKIKKRYFHYLVFVTNDLKTCLELRSGKGIWQGLYQFPLIELDNSKQSILDSEEFLKKVNTDAKVTLMNEQPIIHKLSHQHLYTHFWKIKVDSHPKATIELKDFKKYPIPVLIDKFMNQSGLL